MLPSFIGIGAHRSGTTWMYEMLKNHPEVCMSQEKEINYFSRNYHRGISWYEGFFAKCQEEKIIGEISPSYLTHEHAPKRMKKITPKVKLILSLRNPVDQVFSRYQYMVNRQMYDKDFDEALREKPFVTEGAFYYKHIKRYLEYFERSQILVLIYEHLRIDALSFLQSIYSFLDISDNYVPPNLNERVHFTRVPRSTRLETSTVIIRVLLRKLGLYSVVEELKKRGLVRKFKEFNTRRNKPLEEMDQKVRAQVNNIFADDKEMLSGLLGIDLSLWN